MKNRFKNLRICHFRYFHAFLSLPMFKPPKRVAMPAKHKADFPIPWPLVKFNGSF